MKIATIAGAFALAGALTFTPAMSTPAHAEDPTATEVLACFGDLAGCAAAQDAKQWAASTTAWKYPRETLHNGAGDAFRHCIWSGALTQRIGPDRAGAIVTRHEDATDSPLQEKVMDSGNNSIGLSIGAKANEQGGSDTWGWIISQCQGMQEAGYLYGIGYDPSGRA